MHEDGPSTTNPPAPRYLLPPLLPLPACLQVNPYYAAGRVTVPASMDTFACRCFFNRCV